MNKLVLGVGTGRCGTKSLTRLLEHQDDTYATHERYGSRVRWDCPPNLWPKRLWVDTMRNDHSIVASVDFKWTNHIEHFLEWGEKLGREVRVVGLKRDRQEVIDSYDKWKPNSDHWSFHGYRETKPDEWDHCYPCYNTDSKREGIGLFWDEVYEKIEKFEKKDERVFCFETEDLNTITGVKAILNFVGYENPKIKKGIKVKSPNIKEARRSDIWEDSVA